MLAYKSKAPNMGPKAPNMGPKSPNMDPNHPIWDQNHSILDPEHLIWDPKHPIRDPKHPIWDQKHQIWDPKHAMHFSKSSDYDLILSFSHKVQITIFVFPYAILQFFNKSFPQTSGTMHLTACLEILKGYCKLTYESPLAQET